MLGSGDVQREVGADVAVASGMYRTPAWRWAFNLKISIERLLCVGGCETSNQGVLKDLAQNIHKSIHITTGSNQNVDHYVGRLMC